MDSQASIYLCSRSSSTACDVSADDSSVAVCGIGFRLPEEIEAGIEARHGAVTQKLLEAVYQTLEDGAEINYRGQEARVGLFMSMKMASVADESSDSSDIEELERENREQLDEMLSVSRYFGLQGPR